LTLREERGKEQSTRETGREACKLSYRVRKYDACIARVDRCAGIRPTTMEKLFWKEGKEGWTVWRIDHISHHVSHAWMKGAVGISQRIEQVVCPPQKREVKTRIDSNEKMIDWISSSSMHEESWTLYSAYDPIFFCFTS